jgi:hypothetical protein
VVIVGASGGRISIVKVSVSLAPVSSLTWTVKVKVPAVLGTPLISPVLPAKSNSFVPGGARPSTPANRSCAPLRLPESEFDPVP